MPANNQVTFNPTQAGIPGMLESTNQYLQSLVSGGGVQTPAFNRAVIQPAQQKAVLAGLGNSSAIPASITGALVPFQLQAAQQLQGLQGQLFGQPLQARAQGLAEELGRGQLGLGQRAQTLAEQIQPGQLALQRELGLGQLGLGQRAQSLAEQIQPGQLALSRELGLGGLSLQGQQLGANTALQALNLALQQQQQQAQSALQQQQAFLSQLQQLGGTINEFGLPLTGPYQPVPFTIPALPQELRTALGIG